MAFFLFNFSFCRNSLRVGVVMDIPIVFFKGFAMGIILAVTVPPATIWLVQTGFRRSWFYSMMAGFGIASGNAFVTGGVGYIMFLALPLWPYLGLPARGLTLLILAYMGWKSFWAKKAESVALPKEIPLPPNGWHIFQQSFYILVTMPMRIPLTFAYMIATAIFWRFGGVLNIFPLMLGCLLGGLAWTSFICLIGWASKGRVDEPIILKSLNKLHRFAAYVLGVLFLITLYPLLALAT